MSQLAVISESTVRSILTRQLAFDAVRQAFEAIATGQSKVFDVVIGDGLDEGEIFGIKSGNDARNRLVGFKCGTYWAGNFDKGIPAHGSTTVLLDPDSGFPQVLVNANYMNGIRTAAADAIAVAHLSREDSEVLGVIGAGHQAEQEIRSVSEVRALSLVKIHTRSEARAEWITNQLSDLEVDIRLTSAEEAVRDSDIVATATPSQTPIVLDEWVGKGTHISAMGADTRGKQELDTAILKRAKLFAEYPKQSVSIGEFQHALREGVIKAAEDIGALGLVTLGQAPGRTSDAEITVFDSSGIAAQDLAVASAVFEAAKESGHVDFIDF